MTIISNEAWLYFLADDYQSLEQDSAEIGKWMFFFNINDISLIEEICARAIDEEVVKECKCSNPDGMGTKDFDTSQGVACFYCDYHDEIAHRRILKYFIDNNLIRKTKTGKLYNISFKLDEQTENGEYGRRFVGAIKLSQFVDLSSGQFL